MHPIFEKSFGGLTRSYYFRQLFFGAIMAGLMMWNSIHLKGFRFEEFKLLIWMSTSALLYPYARFVYESIVGFLVGDNVFYLNAWVMMVAKLVTMMACFFFAIFIAPIGLVYLYFYHSSRAE